METRGSPSLGKSDSASGSDSLTLGGADPGAGLCPEPVPSPAAASVLASTMHWVHSWLISLGRQAS